MKKIFPAILILLLLNSCSHTVIKLQSKSPDSKTVVTVDGDKPSALDPYKVVVHVKSGDIPEGSLEFEIAAGQLDEKTVTFDWQDSNNCVIKFIQSDGEQRKFALRVSDTNVILAEQKDNPRP